MKYLFIIVLVLCSVSAYQQTKTIDSLKKVLQTQKEDTNRVNTLNELCYQIISDDPKAAFQQINEALALSKKMEFKRGAANAHNNLGQFYRMEGDYNKAATEHLNAAQINEQINDKAGLSRSYYSAGYSYSLIDNYPLAFKHLFLALKISEEIRDSVNIIRTLVEIGRNYMYQGDFINERKEYEMAVKYVNKPLFDQNFVVLNLDVCHAMYRLGNYQRAFEWSKAAMKIHKESGNVKGLAHDHTQLAYIYDKWGDSMSVLKHIELAEKYYANASINYQEAEKKFSALDSSTTIGRGNISAINCNLGEFYIKRGNLDMARFCLNKSLLYAKKLGWWDNLKDSYHGLYRLDSAKGNFEQAFENYKLYTLYKDSITNKENLAKAESSRLQYEFYKKEATVKAIQDKKDAITLAEIKNQKLIRNFSVGGAFAVLSFGGYSFYRYRRRRKLQSQQEMLNERLRISRELHDDVGATLSGIAMYSHLAKEQLKTNQNSETERSLNVVHQSAGEMVNKLSDIVWLINPDHGSLRNLADRLEEYAINMASVKNMQVKVHVPEKIAEIDLPMETRRNIYLICKEAINNAVKYSEGSLLELTIKEVDKKLEFTIIDNGKGFDMVNTKKGNGLMNMQRRSDEIGTQLSLHSQQNEGSVISVQVKITQ